MERPVRTKLRILNKTPDVILIAYKFGDQKYPNSVAISSGGEGLKLPGDLASLEKLTLKMEGRVYDIWQEVSSARECILADP